MADKENRRKCSMCGKSPAKDSISLFRFPKPAKNNNLRCTLWAKYMFPVGEEYNSTTFQIKLHNEHRMLCQNHFGDNDFTETTKKKLKRTAFPRDTEEVSILLPSYYEMPKVDLSTTIQVESQPKLRDIGNQKLEQPRSFSRQVLVGLTLDESPAGPSTCMMTSQHHNHDIPNQQLEQPGSSSGTRQALVGLTLDESPAGTNSTMTSGTNKWPRNIHSENERILYAKCTKYMRDMCQLRNRIKNLKNKIKLNILTEDNSVKKLSKKISPTFAHLLQAQIRNSKKKATGYRWTKEDKIMALRLYKRSPTCYRLLRRLFHLPSPGTLKSLLNKVPFSVGTSQPVLKVLSDLVNTLKPSDNEFILMFDEMSIKKHLEYNRKDDLIEGYQDHGIQGRSPTIASYALVFMIVGIRKTVKQPIAHYFSSGFATADRLAVLIKEVLNQCFQAGINISATVCDMDGVNRRALSILGANVEQPYMILNNKEIVTLFDTPHLLKCFRNLFMKYDIECKTNISSSSQIGIGVAKWSHIKVFFEMDNNNPNFVFAPALTKDHLDPNTKQKMRVKLAAQVLSHTVAAGLYAKIADGALSAEASVTANVISNIDKLFDCLNSETPDLRRGKTYATNLTEKTPHLQLFSEMKTFFKELKFIGARQPPSQNGWIWTINGVERLFKNLIKVHGIRSLATRRLHQDPLQNLFGSIRGNCGSNTNPTTGQFVAGLKTSILSSLAHIGSSGRNCEKDNNKIMNNFEKFLSSTHTHPQSEPQSESEVIGNLSDFPVELNVDEISSAEEQACAYVTGFLLKQLPTNCEVCRKSFVSDEVDKCHLFVECREYRDCKRSLKYATKQLIHSIEQGATIINMYLKENGHTTQIKQNLVDKVKQTVNFNFISCQFHKDKNICKIISSLFIICVKRFCIVSNRAFADEASSAALKRKMKIVLHK